MLRKAVPFVLQQHHSADEFVPGKDAAQDGDDDIEIAILVQVHNRRVRRTFQVVSQNALLKLTPWNLAIQNHGVPSGVADQNVIQTIPV